jgi:hypothetical protein
MILLIFSPPVHAAVLLINLQARVCSVVFSQYFRNNLSDLGNKECLEGLIKVRCWFSFFRISLSLFESLDAELLLLWRRARSSIDHVLRRPN